MNENTRRWIVPRFLTKRILKRLEKIFFDLPTLIASVKTPETILFFFSLITYTVKSVNKSLHRYRDNNYDIYKQLAFYQRFILVYYCVYQRGAIVYTSHPSSWEVVNAKLGCIWASLIFKCTECFYCSVSWVFSVKYLIEIQIQIFVHLSVWEYIGPSKWYKFSYWFPFDASLIDQRSFPVIR